MGRIFAEADRMSTGAKLLAVGIGIVFMLVHSLENQPVAQRVAQQPPPTTTPTPSSSAIPAPTAGPSARPRPVGPAVRESSASGKAVIEEGKESLAPAAPGTSATKLAEQSGTAAAVPVIAAPQDTATTVAPEPKTKAKLSSAELAPSGYFTLGSTKDDVLRTQGFPSKGVNEYQWSYGLSSVQFRDGRVASWNVSPLNPLRAVLIPHDQDDAAAARAKGFFTVGSSTDEVIGAQGTPSRFSDTQWSYGLSSVEFRGGAVVSWNNSPLNPLRARLLPTAPGDGASAKNRGFFTVGSTKDEVLGVQGTPSRFSDTHWSYGLSSVEFRGGAVLGWNASPLNPLQARLLPVAPADSASAKSRGFFTVGSTKDEVLGVQGTPSRFSDTHWSYGLSSVHFQNGVVTTWKASQLNPLRVALVPQSSKDMEVARARGYFVTGSTKDEVLGVQGTPSSFSDTHWLFGLSSISFQNGRVTSWNSSPLNPLRVRRLP